MPASERFAPFPRSHALIIAAASLAAFPCRAVPTHRGQWKPPAASPPPATPKTATQWPYTLLRASIHSHTKYSDGGTSVASHPSEKDPGSAAAEAKANGLTAYATSDHGEYILPALWDDPSTGTKALSAKATTPGTFLSLWGFEWTATADGFPPNATGVGHIGVYGSAPRTGAANTAGNTMSQAELTPELTLLYQWMKANGQSPLGGTIVGQFNHADLYPRTSFASPSLNHYVQNGGIQYYDWWRKLEWVADADPYMDLFEMGCRSGATPYYINGAYNEPYFQLALDNGWHVAPTNNEDNHSNSYGALPATYYIMPGVPGTVLTTTGVWAEPTAGLTDKAAAQAKFLDALRQRRVFSSEDVWPTGKTAAQSRPNSLSLSLTFNTLDGVKWMGRRDLTADDVSGANGHLELVKPTGLLLANGAVQIISNRGVVVKTLPLSQATLTTAGSLTTQALWNFGLPGDATTDAQLRTFSSVQPANPDYTSKPLPPVTDGNVLLDASPSGHVDRYYYVRVYQSDGTWAYSAPVWIPRYAGGAHKTAVSYTWDFGDGSDPYTESAGNATDGFFDGRTPHAYANGTWYPRLTVQFSDGTVDTAVTAVSVGSTTAPILYGDANNDGQVNQEDLGIVMKLAAGLAPATDTAQMSRANVYPPADRNPVHPLPPGLGTGIDIADAFRLARFLTGNEPGWP